MQSRKRHSTFGEIVWRDLNSENNLEVFSIVETRAGKTTGNLVQMPQWENLRWV